jgi:hypothetical protein
MKIVLPISLLLLLSSCTKSTDSGKPDFDIIQEQILSPTCATSGCHSSSSDATFQQHGLILSAGQSYDQLVRQLPLNAAARASNYKLVSPGDAELSFLYHKITCVESHHPVNGNFGSQMPLGGQVLSKGQVEFIRRWINAGASRTSSSIDDNVLRDSSALLFNRSTRLRREPDSNSSSTPSRSPKILNVKYLSGKTHPIRPPYM